MIVAGADGCRTGWVVCRRDADGALDIRVVKTLAEACEGLSILAVDMPIGFVAMGGTPEELGKWTGEQASTWGPVLQAAGIKPE